MLHIQESFSTVKPDLADNSSAFLPKQRSPYQPFCLLLQKQSEKQQPTQSEFQRLQLQYVKCFFLFFFFFFTLRLLFQTDQHKVSFNHLTMKATPRTLIWTDLGIHPPDTNPLMAAALCP